MPWGRVDDSLHGHPKVLRAGLEAMGLWAVALSYVSQYLTDGVVPVEWVETLRGEPDARGRRRYVGLRLAATLVRVGLWEGVNGVGWRFHDFLDHNPSASSVRADRAAKSAVRAEAGRLGGLKSGQARRSNGEANAEANAEAKRTPIPSHPSPIPERSTEPRASASLPERGDSAPLALAPVTSGKPAKKLQHETPATLEVLEHWAAKSWHGRRPLLTPERHRRVAARLADGLSVADMKSAIDGAEKDPWIMGTDPKSPRAYTGIETILRDVPQVERLRALAGPPPSPASHRPELRRGPPPVVFCGPQRDLPPRPPRPEPGPPIVRSRAETLAALSAIEAGVAGSST